MDLSKLDPQWVLAQGIAVFVCVILCSLLMVVVGWLLRVIVKELRALQVAQMEASKKYEINTGQLIGAIRWLGEQIRAALKIAPPASPGEGFGETKHRRSGEDKSHAHGRNGDPKTTPGRKPDGGIPTPAAEPFDPDSYKAEGGME